MNLPKRNGKIGNEASIGTKGFAIKFEASFIVEARMGESQGREPPSLMPEKTRTKKREKEMMELRAGLFFQK